MTKDQITKKAIATLEGVEQIVENEMLMRGKYVSTNIVDRKLRQAGAVCGGRKACLIGSLYLAHAVPGTRIDEEQMLVYTRRAYMARRPALRLAFDALNKAAIPRMGKLPSDVRRALRLDMSYPNGDELYSTAEMLLEQTDYLIAEEGDRRWEDTIDRTKVLSLVRSAKKLVADGKVAA